MNLSPVDHVRIDHFIGADGVQVAMSFVVSNDVKLWAAYYPSETASWPSAISTP
jgi:hypothetical protein